MLSSFWSCASLRSVGGMGNLPHRPLLCAWGSPPRPLIPQGTVWPWHPCPSPCSSQGGLSRVRGRGSCVSVHVALRRIPPPHSCPPAGRGRAEVASASSCRDRTAVTLQMLRKVIAGPAEGDEEKGEKEGLRQEGGGGAAQPQAGPGAQAAAHPHTAPASGRGCGRCRRQLQPYVLRCTGAAAAPSTAPALRGRRAHPALAPPKPPPSLAQRGAGVRWPWLSLGMSLVLGSPLWERRKGGAAPRALG